MRGRGPVSAAIADLVEDPTVDESTLKVERARVKAEALAGTALVEVNDPKRGPVGEMLIDVGKRTVVVTDVHVDEVGALVCTVTHPAIPVGANPFRFVNPPVGVRDADDAFVEDPAEAFRQMIADVVAAVTR